MKFPQLLVTLLIFIVSSQSTSILDPNDVDLDFVHAAKELVSFVRLDIKKLNRQTRPFNTTNVRQNQLKVIQHLKKVKEKLDQIEKLHLTPSEKKLYYNFGDGSYLEGAIDWISSDLDIGFCDDCKEETLLNLTKKAALLKFTFFMYKNDFYKELHGIVCDYDYILVKCARTQLNRWTKIYELPLNAMCKVRQSPQQLFYSFYKDIALAELKAYILIEYGLMIHRVTRNLHFYKRRMNLLRNYDELTERALKTLSNVVEKADRVLFRCDPPLQNGNITSNVNEVRYFNLRETLSDVKANKVVTGVRFVKSNRVFHLQIQQGQLLPRGFINASTVEWKPVSNYDIEDLNIQEGVDYHALSKRSHAFDLDDVMKTDDKTFIVTGMRFRVVDGHLNLQVHLSKFDFLKGELANSIWQSKENTHYRQQIVLTPPVNSSQPLSKDNQYLEFTLEDNPQKTVPIIDVQEVASDPSVPLAGIGIYYRASGFVAPKIISYDILSYLSVITN